MSKAWNNNVTDVLSIASIHCGCDDAQVEGTRNQGARQQRACDKPGGSTAMDLWETKRQWTCWKPGSSTAIDLWETTRLNSNGPVGNQRAQQQWTCGKPGGSTAMDLWETRGLHGNGHVGNWGDQQQWTCGEPGGSTEMDLLATMIVQPLLCTLSGE